jgi:predicted secreted protein
MRAPWLTSAVAAAALASPGWAAEPTVAADASTTDVTVGEAFTVTLTLDGPEGTVWQLPESVGDETVELRPAVAPAGVEATPPAPGTHVYQAAAFALGEAAVPAIPVRYRLPDGTEGELATEPISLRIVSVLPKDPEEQKLVDIRQPLEASIGRAFWISLALVAALLGALVVWLIRRRRRQDVAEPAPRAVVPPDKEALEALDRLARAGLVSRGEFRSYYIELTLIAKRYLERRLGAPVVEMTSAEMVAFLRDHPHGQPLLSPARELASAADRVKFARAAALAQEAERHLDSVREWIGVLEQSLQPRPAVADEGAS